MGGLGKTTLAASCARHLDVRTHFDRVGFASAGQEPVVVELQRELHQQLAGSAMHYTPDATPASQKETLQTAAASDGPLCSSASMERKTTLMHPLITPG